MVGEKQLGIPTGAAKDNKAFELLRVWVADGSQQVSLRGGVWEDPAAWGVMLADLARSIVTLHTEASAQIDGDVFLTKLLEGFDEEIDSVIDEFSNEPE